MRSPYRAPQMLRAFDAATMHGDAPRWKPSGGFSCKCPAHADRSPSLSVDPGRHVAVVVRCFAGCEAAEVLAAWDLTFRDLGHDTQEAVALGARDAIEVRGFGAAGIVSREVVSRHDMLAAFDAAVPLADAAEAITGAVLAFPHLTLAPTGHGISLQWLDHRPALRAIVEAAAIVATERGSTAAVTLASVAEVLDRAPGTLAAVGGAVRLQRLAAIARPEHIAAHRLILATEAAV